MSPSPCVYHVSLLQHEFITAAQPCSVLQRMITEAKEMVELQNNASKLGLKSAAVSSALTTQVSQLLYLRNQGQKSVLVHMSNICPIHTVLQHIQMKIFWSVVVEWLDLY